MSLSIWDSMDIRWVDEPMGTVLSDAIWDKFDLEAPTPLNNLEDFDFTIEEEEYKEPCSKTDHMVYIEIRHDCMWMGLCVNDEHCGRMCKKIKNNPLLSRTAVPAGRSLLIPRATTSTTQQQHNRQQNRRTDNLESDGDSIRSETPQFLSESDSECEFDVPIFKHDQISIDEKLSEWMTTGVPVSEVTGQYVRNNHFRRKEDTPTASPAKSTSGNRTNVSIDVATEDEIRNTTMSDHCYHINETSMTRLTDLGVQTPSDSDEEIDVVNDTSLEKLCRPAALPTHPNSVDHKTFQLTVNTALKEKPAPRPRGRPPSKANRKRVAQEEDQRPAKRTATQRTCQKKTKATKNTVSTPPQIAVAPISIPISSTVKSVSLVKSCYDEEPDNDKRNLHNNMERQRRIELRHAFDDLRRLVPEIEAKEKAAKVAILQQAADYCGRLKQIYDENVIIEAIERKRQKKRMAKIQHLRLTLAKLRQGKYFVDNFRKTEVKN